MVEFMLQEMAKRRFKGEEEDGGELSGERGKGEKKKTGELLYSIEDTPPWSGLI